MGHLSGYYIGKANQQQDDAKKVSIKAVEDAKKVQVLQDKINAMAIAGEQQILNNNNNTNEVNNHVRKNAKSINANNTIRDSIIRMHNAVILQKAYAPTASDNTGADRKCNADNVLIQMNENIRRCNICFNRYQQCQEYVKNIIEWYNDE